MMRKMMPVNSRFIAAIAFVAAILLVTGTPASAHSDTITVSNSSATISADHATVVVCNNEGTNGFAWAVVMDTNNDFHSYHAQPGSCISHDIVSNPLKWRLCAGPPPIFFATCSPLRSV
jgi:hypothetical protein